MYNMCIIVRFRKQNISRNAELSLITPALCLDRDMHKKHVRSVPSPSSKRPDGFSASTPIARHPHPSGHDKPA